MNSTKMTAADVPCECGRWSGERCHWSGPADQTVKIEFVRESQQGTAEAAGTWHGVAETIHVYAECAGLMRGCDPDWTELVGPLPAELRAVFDCGEREGKSVAAEAAEARAEAQS